MTYNSFKQRLAKTLREFAERLDRRETSYFMRSMEREAEARLELIFQSGAYREWPVMSPLAAPNGSIGGGIVNPRIGLQFVWAACRIPTDHARVRDENDAWTISNI